MVTPNQHLDTAIGGDNVAVAQAVQTGSGLLDIVEVLDSDRGLRVAVTDISATAEQRPDLIRGLFVDKASEATLNLVVDVTTQVWSTPREMREGLVGLDRRALLYSAEGQEQPETVKSELFQLEHILAEQPQLEQLPTDKAATLKVKRGLLTSVLYGRVTSVTEALALQVVGRSSKRLADGTDSLSRLAAGLRNHVVTCVTSVTVVSDGQERILADKLGRVYGKAMSIHAVADKSIFSGLIIRVGDEVIDGNLSTKLEKLHVDLD